MGLKSEELLVDMKETEARQQSEHIEVRLKMRTRVCKILLDDKVPLSVRDDATPSQTHRPRAGNG